MTETCFVKGMAKDKHDKNLALPYVLHNRTFYFGKCCPHFTYIGGPNGRNYVLQNGTFFNLFLGSFHHIILFFIDGPIKLAHCNQKKLILNLGGTSFDE